MRYFPCMTIGFGDLVKYYSLVHIRHHIWIRHNTVKLHTNESERICSVYVCVCVCVLGFRAHTSHRTPRAIERIVATISQRLSVVARCSVTAYSTYSIKQLVFLYRIIIIMIPRIALDAVCCAESV